MSHGYSYCPDVTTVCACLEITDMYHSLALSVSNNYYSYRKEMYHFFNGKGDLENVSHSTFPVGGIRVQHGLVLHHGLVIVHVSVLCYI